MENVQETQQPQTEKTVRVENDTKFTRESLKKFYEWIRAFGVICTVIGGLLFLSDLIWMFVADEDTPFLTAAVGFLAFGIAMLVLHKLYVKNNKMVTDNTHTIYRFYDDELVALDFDGDNKRGESHVFYKQIVRVKKRGDYYQLFLGAVALLVDRNAFTVGTETDMKALLKEKCGEKTVKCK